MLVFKYLVYLPAVLAQRNDNTKQKEYAMIQKSTYMAPNAEYVIVATASAVLINTSVGTTSTETMEKLNGSWDD